MIMLARNDRAAIIERCRAKLVYLRVTKIIIIIINHQSFIDADEQQLWWQNGSKARIEMPNFVQANYQMQSLLQC